MNARALTAVLLALVAALGCSTLKKANEAQESIEGKARGDAVAVEKLVLTGASLETLVNFALTNRPSVNIARLAVEDARLAMKQIAAEAPIISSTPWTAPKLSVSGGYSESSTARTLSEGGWEMSGSPSAALSLQVLVWDFGRNQAQAEQQAEKTIAAELALEQEGYAVFGEVANAYFTFLERRSLLEVALTNELQYADHLRRAEERRRAGEAYKLDVLKARLDLANARQSVVAASNLVETSGAALMNALGIDAARGTWETVYNPASMDVQSVRRGFPATTFDVDTAFVFARTNSPSVQAERASLRAASHAVDYAKRDLLPSVSVSGSLSWTDPTWVWSWGASVVQTLFQGFRKTTAIDRAVNSLRQAEGSLDRAEQQLSLSLETAVANRDNSVSSVQSAMASLKSAKENLDTVREQYAVGSVSRIELSDAIASYSEASGAAITAFYDGQRAEAQLYRFLGKYPVYAEELVKEEIK